MSGGYASARDVLLDLLPKSQHGKVEAILSALRANDHLMEGGQIWAVEGTDRAVYDTERIELTEGAVEIMRDADGRLIEMVIPSELLARVK